MDAPTEAEIKRWILQFYQELKSGTTTYPGPPEYASWQTEYKDWLNDESSLPTIHKWVNEVIKGADDATDPSHAGQPHD